MEASILYFERTIRANLINLMVQRAAEQGVQLSADDAASRIQPGALLQSEFALRSGNGTVPFTISENQNARTSETRLNVNDAFVATRIGIALKKELSTTPGAGVLQFYPNATVFPDVTAEVANADLNAFFNSKLSITVDNFAYVPGMDMSLSWTVRTTQQSSATTKSERFGDDGLIPIASPITLSGSKNNVVVLNMPAWSGQLIQLSTSGAGMTIYGVLKAYGFLISGGSDLGRLQL